MAELLKGLTLSRKDGTKTEASDLKDKVVAFYYSAHWCPPCRNFTPILAEFYNEVNKENHEFEIVFLSWDEDEETAKEYLAESHANWLYIPPKEDIVNELGKKFKVDGIPTVIVFKPDGTVISKHARSEIMGYEVPESDDGEEEENEEENEEGGEAEEEDKEEEKEEENDDKEGGEEENAEEEKEDDEEEEPEPPRPAPRDVFLKWKAQM